MVCLGLKPGAEGWKAQTNPLSCGGTPKELLKVSLYKVEHNLGAKLSMMHASSCNKD